MSSDLRFHHVGIACRDVPRTLKFITDTYPVKRVALISEILDYIERKRR